MERMKQLIIHPVRLFEQGDEVVVVLPVVQLLVAVHDVGEGCKVVLIVLQRSHKETCDAHRVHLLHTTAVRTSWHLYAPAARSKLPRSIHVLPMFSSASSCHAQMRDRL
jgi:hypothetical protein|eukprot:COSAG06_NODE_550_length_14402_cov_4.593092_11_plen_109_part_00